jgi:hypothetical protein
MWQVATTAAWMSSTQLWRGEFDTVNANKCIDDDNGNFCMTEFNTNDPWLLVTLEERVSVGRVVIHGREDCCQNLLSPYDVLVGPLVKEDSIQEVSLHDLSHPDRSKNILTSAKLCLSCQSVIHCLVIVIYL